jgi:hypothetical protein
VRHYMATDVEPVETANAKGLTSVGTLGPQVSDRTGRPGCIFVLECRFFYSGHHLDGERKSSL